MLLLAGVGGVCALARRAWPLWPAIAFVWTVHVASAALEARVPSTAQGLERRVAGWIDGVPDMTAARTVFSLRVDASDPMLANARLRLSWYEPTTPLAPGDAVELTVRLRHPRGYANPDGFDYERWLFIEGYAATGYVRAIHSMPVPHSAWAARVWQFRWRLSEQVREHVVDASAAAVINALALGERSGISDTLWTTLRRTGTSHLIAISGLHVGLISGFGFLLAGFAARRGSAAMAGRDLEIAAVTAIVMGVAYAMLAGFALPTRRAAIMVAYSAIIVLSRRRVGALNGLAVALILVLALDPLATLAASFWMSFGAVAVLIVCASPRRLVPLTRRTPLRQRLSAAVALQVCLTLALTPLAGAFFGGVSLLAVPVNLVAIPIFCIALIPAALLAVLALALVPSFALPVELVGGACALVCDLLTRAASLPGTMIEMATPGPLTLTIAAGGVVLALPWHRGPGRALAWLALLPLAFPRQDRPDEGELDLTLLDVGHGLAVVLATHAHRMVYDAGPLARSGFDAGAEILVPALRAEPARGLDLMLISHADHDHSGGAGAVKQAFPGAEVLHGPDVATGDGRVCTRGQQWEWDGVAFEILHPAPAFPGRGNDGSCVLKVETRTQSVLLTGDIERRAEQAVVASGAADVDVVIVPHHGSATSSSPGLVAATSPSLALVSAGYANRWGFPVPEVRERWRAAGARLYITGDSGAIRLRLGGGAPRLVRERERHRRYWHTLSGDGSW